MTSSKLLFVFSFSCLLGCFPKERVTFNFCNPMSGLVRKRDACLLVDYEDSTIALFR